MIRPAPLHDFFTRGARFIDLSLLDLRPRHTFGLITIISLHSGGFSLFKNIIIITGLATGYLGSVIIIWMGFTFSMAFKMRRDHLTSALRLQTVYYYCTACIGRFEIQNGARGSFVRGYTTARRGTVLLYCYWESDGMGWMRCGRIKRRERGFFLAALLDRVGPGCGFTCWVFRCLSCGGSSDR